MVTDKNWPLHQQQAQALQAEAEHGFAQAEAADQDAEAAWRGMPEPSRRRLWLLITALLVALALAAIVFSSQPPVQ